MRGVLNLTKTSKTSYRETKVSALTLKSHTESVLRGQNQSNEYKFGSFGGANDHITHSNRSNQRQQIIDQLQPLAASTDGNDEVKKIPARGKTSSNFLGDSGFNMFT